MKQQMTSERALSALTRETLAPVCFIACPIAADKVIGIFFYRIALQSPF